MDNPMLTATTTKMTGLDLGPSSGVTTSHQTHSPRTLKELKSRPWSPMNADDTSLQTPKLTVPDSAGFNLSPRNLSDLKPDHDDKKDQKDDGSSSDGMLMTPVIVTPKIGDAWNSFRSNNGSNKSPNPEDESEDYLKKVGTDPTLPMDSDIGLRSPCEGAVARRRRDRMKKASSLTSDTNSNHSCDTLSESSPKDSTVKPAQALSVAETDKPVSKSPTTLKARIQADFMQNFKVQDSPTPKKSPEDVDFKHPSRKPENLSLTSKDMPSTTSPAVSGLMGPMPSHYTQSPLKSPNWNAINENFGGEIWKTPKVLEGNNFFDFLPPPNTPRGKLGSGPFRDHSPGIEYSSCDARLSPQRLSPRFLIPEAPTDLSSNRDGSTDPEEAAQDLSMAKKPPDDVDMASLGNTSGITIKREEILMHPANKYNAEAKNSPEFSEQQKVEIKTEVEEYHAPDLPGNGDNPIYASLRQQHQVAAQHVANMAENLYLQSIYNRHLYGQDLQRTSPPEMTTGGSQSRGLSPNPSPQEPNMLQYNLGRSQHLPPAYGSGNWPPPNTSPGPIHGPPGGQLEGLHPAWNQEDEQSISPPHPFGRKASPSAAAALLASASGLKSGLFGLDHTGMETIPKKRGRKPGGLSEKMEAEKKGRKGKRSGAKSAAENGATKRVFSCPRCQRSYDWNYNLNRHLKYECGKQNAFECSKCGRRFPHKQNCVYHLKRKHKLNLDTIDQYVSNGYILFHGGSIESKQMT